ncbi:hypothetical protein JVU11DRAFT_3845 [Chiua virens]|nr:hypothetical protein JVU11DRAFT_3845 [Chiua virens]
MREKIADYLRKNTLLLEMHMKISKVGELLVRRLVHGSAEVKEIPIPATGLTGPSSALAAYFPPALKASDVEIEVKALGIESGASSKSAVVFVGSARSHGVAATAVDVGTGVVGIACRTPADILVVPQDVVIPLSDGISAADAVAVPVTFLSAWIALIACASISASSTVPVHDGTSAAGSAAVQVAKRFNAKVFTTVANQQEVDGLSDQFGIPKSNVAIIDDLSLATLAWIRSGSMSHFDVIFNRGGKKAYAHGSEHLSLFGSYFHIQSDEAPEIPPGTIFTYSGHQPIRCSVTGFPHTRDLCDTLGTCFRTLRPPLMRFVVPETSPIVMVDPAGHLNSSILACLAYLSAVAASLSLWAEGVHAMSSLAYTFDPFTIDVFGMLYNGTTLVTRRKELVPGDIPKALRTLRINVLHVTPSILAVVPVDDYPCLETIVVAGEALGKKLIEDWSGRVALRNISSSLTGVIGCPLPNCRIYILDKQLRPVPVGVEGEIFTGGIQFARGYLNQPELSETTFIPNPFLPGKRMYKSGDVALYRTDGNIESCGRTDRQIKLRGQHIELGEVEDTIPNYPAVQQGAVVIRSMQDVPAIVVFVELKAEAQSQLEDHKEGVKMFVAERLPRFMYPFGLARLRGERVGEARLAMDRPPIGDREKGPTRGMPAQKMDLTAFTPDLNADMGSTIGDVEIELMNIFSKTLKVQNAAGVISKTFNVHIGLNYIYLRPTVRELGNLIVDAMGQDARAIMEAEDADRDYLIEFLPIKKKGVHPRVFFVHDITGLPVATPFMRIGTYMPNEM